MILQDLFHLSTQKGDACRTGIAHTGAAHAGAVCMGLACDSRQVKPGFVFVAIRGQHIDGHQFINEALQKGAIGLVVSKTFNLHSISEMPVLVCQNTARTLAHMAHYFYGQPSKNMFCLGVTGTNGKTSVTYMAEHILNFNNTPTCVIGTIDSHFNTTQKLLKKSNSTETIQNHNTTPDAIRLNQQLQCFYKLGARAACIEVSSHALSQHRADGVLFDAAVFTNLSQDHLDYHSNMQQYFKAKQRLFTELLPLAHDKKIKPTSQKPKLSTFKIHTSKLKLSNKSLAILNRDDKISAQITLPHFVFLLTYGRWQKQGQEQSENYATEQEQCLTKKLQPFIQATAQPYSWHLSFQVVSQTLQGTQFKIYLYGWTQLKSQHKLQNNNDKNYEFQLLNTAAVCWPLIGDHNIYNALAALGASMAAGCSFKQSAYALNYFQGVPGRLQAVHGSHQPKSMDDTNADQKDLPTPHQARQLKPPAISRPIKRDLPAPHQTRQPYVFIDYAHTPDALEKVLSTLNKIKKARLFVVFGCGGERDTSKRPLMMRCALQNSDGVFLTSDNPRHENPNNIIHDCLAGIGGDGPSIPNASRQDDFKVPAHLQGYINIQIDRKKAIQQALSQARADDIVLIAGKGHENYQLIKDKKIPFNDLHIAHAATSKAPRGRVD